MAPKKKTKPDDIKAATRIVGRAVDALRNGNEWDKTVNDVDAMDKAFGEEEVLQRESFINFMKDKLRSGEHEVRVMQIGPKGELIDVTDKVKAEDLKPEDIRGIQTDDGKTVSLGRNPQSREAAYQALQRMLPGLQPLPPRLSGWTPRPVSGKSESMRRMELILEESDKLLEHWKK
jgi:hypothetical protein